MKGRSAALTALAAGGVLSAASLAVRRSDYIHASEWYPRVPLHESTYLEVSVWGWPLSFVRDSPLHGETGSIGAGDDVFPVSLGIDWAVFSASTALVLAFAMRRPRNGAAGPGTAVTSLCAVADSSGIDETAAVVREAESPGQGEPTDRGDEMAGSTRYGIFKVIATCTHCGNPVVVNGPMTAPKCPSCRKDLELSPDIWSEIIGDYVEEYEDTESGSGNEGTMMSGGLTLKYSCVKLPPPDPACPKCEENWDLDSVENGADRMLSCSKCGHATPVFPAPSWLSEVVPSARQIFFAEKEADQSEEGKETGEERPIALACPQCGGGLVITADCERTVPCKYCNVDVYLPDGVWLKLHPAKVANYWMVRFEG